MSALLPMKVLPAGLAVVLLLTGCAGNASPTATRTATSATSVSAATSAGSGHVIHLNLDVPQASATTLGSACGPAELRATGSKAATIPGARVRFFDFDQASEPITSLGEQSVPDTGTVVKPISDDPSFPAACRFSFDVPTTAVPKTAYQFSVGSIYFPVPLMPRADLEAAGWVAHIGVNPQ